MNKIFILFGFIILSPKSGECESLEGYFRNYKLDSLNSAFLNDFGLLKSETKSDSNSNIFSQNFTVQRLDDQCKKIDKDDKKDQHPVVYPQPQSTEQAEQISCVSNHQQDEQDSASNTSFKSSEDKNESPKTKELTQAAEFSPQTRALEQEAEEFLAKAEALFEEESLSKTLQILIMLLEQEEAFARGNNEKAEASEIARVLGQEIIAREALQARIMFEQEEAFARGNNEKAEASEIARVLGQEIIARKALQARISLEEAEAFARGNNEQAEVLAKVVLAQAKVLEQEIIAREAMLSKEALQARIMFEKEEAIARINNEKAETKAIEAIFSEAIKERIANLLAQEAFIRESNKKEETEAQEIFQTFFIDQLEKNVSVVVESLDESFKNFKNLEHTSYTDYSQAIKLHQQGLRMRKIVSENSIKLIKDLNECDVVFVNKSFNSTENKKNSSSFYFRNWLDYPSVERGFGEQSKSQDNQQAVLSEHTISSKSYQEPTQIIGFTNNEHVKSKSVFMNNSSSQQAANNSNSQFNQQDGSNKKTLSSKPEPKPSKIYGFNKDGRFELCYNSKAKVDADDEFPQPANNVYSTTSTTLNSVNPSQHASPEVNNRSSHNFKNNSENASAEMPNNHSKNNSQTASPEIIMVEDSKENTVSRAKESQQRAASLKVAIKKSIERADSLTEEINKMIQAQNDYMKNAQDKAKNQMKKIKEDDIKEKIDKLKIQGFFFPDNTSSEEILEKFEEVTSKLTSKEWFNFTKFQYDSKTISYNFQGSHLTCKEFMNALQTEIPQRHKNDNFQSSFVSAIEKFENIDLLERDRLLNYFFKLGFPRFYVETVLPEDWNALKQVLQDKNIRKLNLQSIAYLLLCQIPIFSDEEWEALKQRKFYKPFNTIDDFILKKIYEKEEKFDDDCPYYYLDSWFFSKLKEYVFVLPKPSNVLRLDDLNYALKLAYYYYYLKPENRSSLPENMFSPAKTNLAAKKANSDSDVLQDNSFGANFANASVLRSRQPAHKKGSPSKVLVPQNTGVHNQKTSHLLRSKAVAASGKASANSQANNSGLAEKQSGTQGGKKAAAPGGKASEKPATKDSNFNAGSTQATNQNQNGKKTVVSSGVSSRTPAAKPSGKQGATAGLTNSSFGSSASESDASTISAVNQQLSTKTENSDSGSKPSGKQGATPGLTNSSFGSSTSDSISNPNGKPAAKFSSTVSALNAVNSRKK